jgi:site-specific DNA recombinase
MKKPIVRAQGKRQRRQAWQADRQGIPLQLLNNRVYVGEAVHKGTAYLGEHQAIIDRPLWDRVHAILTESPSLSACSNILIRASK